MERRVSGGAESLGASESLGAKWREAAPGPRPAPKMKKELGPARAQRAFTIHRSRIARGTAGCDLPSATLACKRIAIAGSGIGLPEMRAVRDDRDASMR